MIRSFLTWFIGSSPRARGTGQRRRLRSAGVRFIPASAGNSQPTTGRSFSPTVHPRERGEQFLISAPSSLSSGSSPRARGTDHEHAVGRHCHRFIPASAGNSCFDCRRSRAPPVHPRERGEQDVADPTTNTDIGSSPRARGTVHEGGHPNGLRRFIPASAGNRPSRIPLNRLTTVHPRERGEQSTTNCIEQDLVRSGGSSPRARGTADDEHAVGQEPARIERFIPASAGNRYSQST